MVVLIGQSIITGKFDGNWCQPVKSVLDCFDYVFDYFLIVFWIEGKTTLECCLIANFKNHEKLKSWGQ